MKAKIAIACQGGGSQTAFTAGALKALFDNKVQDYFNIVSLSGTMIDFWEDNSARTPQEKLFNDSAIKALELASKGLIPQYNLSPSSPITKTLFSIATYGLRSRFTNFDQLLRAHIDFSELATWGAKPEPPILLMGACNVLTGKLSKFNSREEAVKIEHILASACVPNIFPAVTIETMAYWDGLFSDNPPIRSLIRREFVGVPLKRNSCARSP